jgi:hypothetical protein
VGKASLSFFFFPNFYGSKRVERINRLSDDMNLVLDTQCLIPCGPGSPVFIFVLRVGLLSLFTFYLPEEQVPGVDLEEDLQMASTPFSAYAFPVFAHSQVSCLCPLVFWRFRITRATSFTTLCRCHWPLY